MAGASSSSPLAISTPPNLFPTASAPSSGQSRSRDQYRACLAGQVRSSCRGLLGERDVVSELLDESAGLAFGVAVDEVVGAEVAVALAGVEHLPDRAEQHVLDGTECAFWPRRGLSRW